MRGYEVSEWIQELVDKKIAVVCDPTMLLSKEEWRTFAMMMSNIHREGNFIATEQEVL